MPNISIRPLTLDDIDDIIRVKNIVIKQPHFNFQAEKEICEWMLRNNPYRRNDFPFGFVLEYDNNIVGSVALIPANFKMGEKIVYGCFEVDLMVLPEFRFHGLKLLNKIWTENLFPLVISTTPNKVSLEIESKMGAAEVTFTSRRYVKIVNPIQVILSIRHVNLEKINSLSQGLIIFLRDITMGMRVKERFITEETTEFDERFDVLYDRVSKDYAISQIKNSHYLNWRYVKFPCGERKIYSILDDKNMLRGFTVIQIERIGGGIRRKANVLELFTTKEDYSAIATLSNIVFKYAKQKNSDYIQISPVSIAMENIISNQIFMMRSVALPLCLYKCGNAELCKIAKDMNNWLISSGDGDTATHSACY